MYCDDCKFKSEVICRKVEVDMYWEEGELKICNCDRRTKEKPFPKIMKSSFGMIVGFSSPKCGFVLQLSERNACHYELFGYKENWIMRTFEDIDGVTLY